MDDETSGTPHIPVMVEEVVNYLHLQSGQRILDCTVGAGGHAIKIMDKINPGGILIGIDKDAEILDIAGRYLEKTGNAFKLFHEDYANVDEVLRKAGIDKIDGVLVDLGVSSLQFDQPDRGFSFSKEGLLDMRMDRSRGVTARDLIKRLSEQELQTLFWKYGEERWSRRIAKAIWNERRKGNINSTRDLATIIGRVVPRGRCTIHPATRAFQALRIAVNKELESLEIFLNKIHNFMTVGACIVIISFHSLEDRIVKHTFIEKAKQNIFRIITKKPVIPKDTEMAANVRCRSAKLRVAERI